MPSFILLEQQQDFTKYFLSRRDSVGLVVYGNEIVSVDRDTGKQLYVILTKLAGAMARGDSITGCGKSNFTAH